MKEPIKKDPKVMTLTEIHEEMEWLYYKWQNLQPTETGKELRERYKELNIERGTRYTEDYGRKL